jgi:hypothetical protein
MRARGLRSALLWTLVVSRNRCQLYALRRLTPRVPLSRDDATWLRGHLPSMTDGCANVASRRTEAMVSAQAAMHSGCSPVRNTSLCVW